MIDVNTNFSWCPEHRPFNFNSTILMQLHQAQSRIERILRDNLYIRRTLATSGALEFNRLARYRTSKRVFTRKTEQSGKLYNFIILVDVS